jgi:Methyltransferase domain
VGELDWVERDWVDWHQLYDVPGSMLARRLATVQDRISDALDAARPGPLRAISVCAGQGRDLLTVLERHRRGGDVSARLVDLDPGNVAVAWQRASEAGLEKVEAVVGDASLIDAYDGMVPADLVLACGVFGNITDADIARTVSYLPALCSPGATVVWTRHRRPPDLVPFVCDCFAEQQFEVAWLSDPAEQFGVGVHRFAGRPPPLPRGERLFTFVGRKKLEARASSRSGSPTREQQHEDQA